MGAASADVPAIMVTGGPMLNGRYDGQDLGACTDCRRFWTELRAGTIDSEDVREHRGCHLPHRRPLHGHGHGVDHGQSCAEALGMALPGSAAIPAPD